MQRHFRVFIEKSTFCTPWFCSLPPSLSLPHSIEDWFRHFARVALITFTSGFHVAQYTCQFLVLLLPMHLVALTQLIPPSSLNYILESSLS